MKRIVLTLSILVFMLQACNTSGAATPPPDAAKPQASTQLPAKDTQSPVSTDLPANTPVPVLGSTQIAETDGMTLVFVPGGEFSMGSGSGYANERPVHTVTLDPFWIDQTEVTNAMFAVFVEQSSYQTDAEKAGSSNVYYLDTGKNKLTQGANWQHPLGPDSNLTDLAEHPVVHVSWNDAAAYCKWFGRRLPSEAEWEKAARGTDGRIFPWGDDFDDTRLNSADVNLGTRGNSSLNDGYQFTSPVGSFPLGASPYGALDMAGNAWEWVNDWVDEAYYQSSPSINPTGPESGEYHVVRGGSWYEPKVGQSPSYRGWATPQDTDITLGFRCALSE